MVGVCSKPLVHSNRKSCFPKLLMSLFRILSKPAVEDLREQFGTYSDKQSEMYEGGVPLRDLETSKIIFELVLSDTGSQCKHSKTRVM